jgi:catechol 2,3-dioxygenase-like lactoylglutathione lyase family enzyme
MLLACSHLVVATEDVPRIAAFFADFFGCRAHFENAMFADFVLPSRFRIAFFKPVGASAKYFNAVSPRGTASFGVTAADIDALYRRSQEPAFRDRGVQTGGPPKSHPWGERSFLLIDPDGNRWEITESPSTDGLLVNREKDGHEE